MWDGIIVGGGLAGLVAGITALERGKKVILAAEGAGSLSYASGILDFGDFAALRDHLGHPFSLISEAQALESLSKWQEICSFYQGSWGRAESVLTPLGEIRTAGYVPHRLSAQPLHKARRIILIAPNGLKDFFPELFASNLAANFPKAKVTLKPLQVEQFAAQYRLGKSILAPDYARYWSSQEGADYLRGFIQETIQESAGTDEGAVLVFPGLSASFEPILQELLAALGSTVVEPTLFPPSPTGMDLYQFLRKKFKDLGGELIINGKAKAAVIEDGYCQSIAIHSMGETFQLKAKSFVLASGGLFGGGILVGPQTIREQVFDCPIFTPEPWTAEGFLEPQPYAQMGIEVNKELQPLKRDGQIYLHNVFVCGRSLAHWDPWADYCGGGVALTTGYLAGSKL
ncbi:anaerobic glycerol-3-phosphate dehydrogenase subunit GlpB [Desulfosporosinus youngiae]|uniref:Glycerol-3-phosphate dehydrogenase, anaerobic, B subunit n=1 Tax=Desulfosporosinus youngiae DSM 17734 TaxID=768710 RepID=H5Y0F0_9FIRM|nr:anaerobic glycerol-3-phosphate dehydrogenase subunit GlpB [Desulfosporosinus youngiae]EHQ92206.1 glycerol-3-phosphate dehydrogenase, anaerobic, B subunit [Desulfosporosinus youngiae DSM 17734]